MVANWLPLFGDLRRNGDWPEDVQPVVTYMQLV